MANNKTKLTNKQKAFKKYYITNGFNGTKACISAGFNERTARQEASRLLSNVNIKEAILKEFEKDGDVIQQALKEIVKIATSDINDYVDIDWDSGVTSIKPLKEIPEGMTSVIKKIKHNRVIKEVKGATKDNKEDIILHDQIEYELYDKQKALDSILKIAGMLREKLDVTSDGEKIEPTKFVIYKGNDDK